MAKGKRFYKKNTNAPAGEGAPELNANQAAAGETVKTNYEGKPNGGQGGKPARQGQKPANKPGGKPSRKFWKGNNRDGNAERNGNRPRGNGEGNDNRNGNGERNGSRPGGNGERNGRPGGNRPNKPRFENRKPQMAGKILVVYYSWSGVTDKAAQKIASVARGNTWRIQPVKAYPSMYGLCVAKAGMEKASGARPEIKGTLPDCSRYEKIAIGFPIWWFNCPNIILSFLEKANMEGKKVYPFCTSKSSGPKSSAETVRNAVPKAEVKDCLDANKLGEMSDEEIKKWFEM